MADDAVTFVSEGRVVLRVTATACYVHGRRVHVDDPDFHDRVVYRTLKRFCELELMASAMRDSGG